MDRSLLTALAALLVASGCPLYAPTLVDCSVHCGADNSCPAGTTCTNSWCRVGAKPDNACECKAGDERPCGGSKGECVPGIQRCVQGIWSTVCLGEGHATQEICDNKDNDCDGVVDNDVTDAPACPLTRGVCSTAKQQCVAGAYLACTTASYGADYEPIETKCDGLDNDCDGNPDATSTVELVPSNEGDFALVGYDGGYAVVYTSLATDGGTTQDLSVTRFDAALTKLSTRLVASGLMSPTIAAAGLNRDVFVVWYDNGKLSAARAPDTGGLTSFGSLDNSAYSDSLIRAGVTSSSLFAAFQADNSNAARLAIWNTSGGAASYRDLNADGGGYFTTSLYSVNVDRTGQYVAINGDAPDDAGTSQSFYATYSTADWHQVGSHYPGYRSVLIPVGATLTSSYSYSVFYNFPPFSQNYSGVYYIPDLLTASTEVTVAEAPDYSVYSTSTGNGGVDAVAKGNAVVMVYMNNQLNQLILATSYRVGSTTMFRTRGIDPAVGFGLPHLAASGGDFLGLAWTVGGKISGRRVCAP